MSALTVTVLSDGSEESGDRSLTLLCSRCSVSSRGRSLSLPRPDSDASPDRYSSLSITSPLRSEASDRGWHTRASFSR